MLKLRNYKFGFDVWGLILFLVIMVPNFIWFAIPATNDVLRNQSVTPILDVIASIFQVIMVGAICILINKERQPNMNKRFIVGIVILIVLYFMGWCLYYLGNSNAFVMFDLCISPCLAFLIFSLVRNNIVALISSSLFMICHVIFCFVNFIM